MENTFFFFHHKSQEGSSSCAPTAHGGWKLAPKSSQPLVAVPTLTASWAPCPSWEAAAGGRGAQKHLKLL